MSAPRQQQVKGMERERDAAREEAEAVRSEVSRHFEESARMFGRLASDYRTFFQHFAQTAQNLGLSEGRARELLQHADPGLIANQPGKPSGPAGADTATEQTDKEGPEAPATQHPRSPETSAKATPPAFAEGTPKKKVDTEADTPEDKNTSQSAGEAPVTGDTQPADTEPADDHGEPDPKSRRN